jgi:hypothetical protein
LSLACDDAEKERKKEKEKERITRVLGWFFLGFFLPGGAGCLAWEFSCEMWFSVATKDLVIF